MTVKGLEEPSLYEKNLSVYRESLTFKDKVDKYLKILRHFVQNLKGPIFSKKIKELDEKKTAYDDSKDKLKDYVIYLGKISRTDNIRINKFQNLSKLLTLIEEEEKINFKRAEREREDLLDLLTKKLAKMEIATLVKKSIDFKKKDISGPDFYEYLFRKAYSCNIDLSKYPNLLTYKTYLDKYDNVEKDVFFEEIFDAERYIADSLFKADDERKLFYLSDDLSILNKLFSVSLTRRLYDYYRQKKDELKTSKFIKFIKEKASWYNMPASINPEVEKLDVYSDKIGNFYQYSFERDEVFIKNLDKYSKDQKALFMVTGGFHTENMIDLLKKNGYSYVLITPKIVTQKDNPYFHLLAGSLSPIESLLSEHTAVLALRNAFGGMADKKDIQYISWITNLLRDFIGMAHELGWQHSEPHKLPSGVLFLTLSLLSEAELGSKLGLTLEQLKEKGIHVEPVGEIEIERDKPLPLYAVVHREEVLFEEAITKERAIEIEVERAAMAIAVGMGINMPVRDAATTWRQQVRDVVHIGFVTLDAEAPSASDGEQLERTTRKKYGSETQIDRYWAGRDGLENRYKDSYAKSLRRELTDKLIEQIIEQIVDEEVVPEDSPHHITLAPGSDGVRWAESVRDDVINELLNAYFKGVLPDNIEEITERIKERLRIVNMQIPYGYHINEAVHVVWAKSIHHLLRYRAREYGPPETDEISRLEDINISLLKTMVSNKDEVNRSFLYRIIEGLESLRSLGVAKEIQQMRENYEAIIRSL